ARRRCPAPRPSRRRPCLRGVPALSFLSPSVHESREASRHPGSVTLAPVPTGRLVSSAAPPRHLALQHPSCPPDLSRKGTTPRFRDSPVEIPTARPARSRHKNRKKRERRAHAMHRLFDNESCKRTLLRRVRFAPSVRPAETGSRPASTADGP